MKTQTLAGPQKIELAVSHILYCPYCNIGGVGQGCINYYQHAKFEHNPFTIRAGGCSGSPVLYDRNGNFVGFMTSAIVQDCTFAFNGRDLLTVNIPEGQTLFVAENADPMEAWTAYNIAVLETLPDYREIGTAAPRFWGDVEYCTWVEQKQIAWEQRVPPHDVLNDQFIRDYVGKLNEFGYPKGKLTLDHGWGVDPRVTGFGTWRVNEDVFPDFRKTADFIKGNGFTPGLWIGFPKIHPRSEAAERNPELVGSAESTAQDTDDAMHYLADCPTLNDYSHDVIKRFYDMGFMKFKIDMSYNNKHEQYPILKAVCQAAKAIDPEIEMELHLPDIFAIQYGDVIRTNDIWATPYLPWQQLVEERYHVCYHSAPGKIINLDHIGANMPLYLTRELFLEHLALYEGKVGYPVPSILPDRLGRECVDALGEYLWAYDKGPRKIVSDLSRAQ